MTEKSEQAKGLYEYLSWRGDLAFESVPLCEVDNLILSLLSYIDFTDIVPGSFPENKRAPALLTATRKYLRAQEGVIKSIGLIIPKEVVTLLARTAKTQRFGLSKPVCFVNRICDEEQKQFSAISFLLTDGSTFVAYRGTDDTLVGWKENFNMSFMHPVPAQREALEYLEYIAAHTSGKIYLGGHSKGGNLAVYAAAKAKSSTKARIAAVYNNDGPGFDRDFIDSEDYMSISERVHTLVPQSSVVGMMLEHEEQYTVVKSNTTGLLQHNGLTWAVMGGSFIHLDDVDEESRLIDSSLKEWLAGISREEREHFVDELFDAFASTNAKTLSELNSDKRKLVKAWNAMDNEARAQLKRCISLVIGKKSKPIKAPEPPLTETNINEVNITETSTDEEG